MQLIQAQSIGFCFGVRRAIDMAEGILKERGSLYILGELIHNASVIRRLEALGAVTVNSIEEVPTGETVLIRSHGVPPKVIKDCAARSLNVKNATCPFVEKIHSIVSEQYSAGRTILIYGKDDHPECIGINGCCEDRGIFVHTAEDIAVLDAELKVCLVSQTTAEVEGFEKVAEAVREHFLDAVIEKTLCPTTAARQKEAEELSKKCSQMLVIGDKTSSNTAKLASVCKKYCKHVHYVSKESELSLEKIAHNDIIGIVSGASAPDWKIREVITRMSEMEKTMAGNPVENDGVETGAAAAVEEPIVAECDCKNEAECACACNAEQTEEPKAEEPAEDKGDGDTDFAAAFEKTLVRIRNGQILTGSVVQIVDGEVCVNIGYKSDGFIPRNEFSSDADVNPADVVKIGDPIEVEVIKVNDGEGNVLLSHKNVESKKMWDTLTQDEHISEKVFEGVGKEVVKGGLIATIEGVRAFVPASQLSTKYVEKIEDMVGKPITLKVIEVDKSRKRIVASHKAVMMEEAEQARKQRWAELEVGSKVKGVVRRLTDFGAFVDIGGGIDGLIHITDVSWSRVKKPSEVLSVGQEVEVLIRDVNVEKQRVSLGYKQLQPKPWVTADQRYPVGSIVEGKVVRIVPFGAFVALEPTIDGLIHISQLGVKRVANVEDELHVGDVVRCKVLDVNTEAKRISLSRREALIEENPEIAEEIAKEKAERERVAAERAGDRQHDNAVQRFPRHPQSARKRRNQQQKHRRHAVNKRHKAQRGQVAPRRAAGQPVPRDERRADQRQRVAQQAAAFAAHGEQADGRRADDRDHRARHSFALNRLVQQHTGKRRDKERLCAHQCRRDERGGKAERGHPAGVMQREQQPRRAGQRDLLFRRAEDGLQFAAPERGNQQQQEADRHAAKGDHHRRRAAGQRPLDHRAGDAHACHGERHEERFLLIVHGVSLSFNAFAFNSFSQLR